MEPEPEPEQSTGIPTAPPPPPASTGSTGLHIPKKKVNKKDLYKGWETDELIDEIIKKEKIISELNSEIRVKGSSIHGLTTKVSNIEAELRFQHCERIVDAKKNQKQEELAKEYMSKYEKLRSDYEYLEKDNLELSEKNKNLEIETKRGETVDMKMIKPKCEIYFNLFIRLYDKMTITKKRLDLYQLYLNRINSVIQLSVITLSIMSSFIQALDSKKYDIFFSQPDPLNPLNMTDINTLPNIEETTYGSTVSIITLSISTYSALVIAGERHFGLQQKQTNVEKLKESYTEPITRIKTNLESLRPWKYNAYYMKTKIDGNTVKFTLDEEKKKEWISMVAKLEKEYAQIVDNKKELDSSLEKIVDVKTMKKYQTSASRKIRRSETDFNENKPRKRVIGTSRWWCCKKKKNINHTYDEEDNYNIDDILEIDQFNKSLQGKLNKDIENEPI